MRSIVHPAPPMLIRSSHFQMLFQPCFASPATHSAAATTAPALAFDDLLFFPPQPCFDGWVVGGGGWVGVSMSLFVRAFPCSSDCFHKKNKTVARQRILSKLIFGSGYLFLCPLRLGMKPSTLSSDPRQRHQNRRSGLVLLLAQHPRDRCLDREQLQVARRLSGESNPVDCGKSCCTLPCSGRFRWCLCTIGVDSGVGCTVR